jgi:hypothetical protein
MIDDPRVLSRFDQLCKLRGSQGHGLSLRDLACCHALARELSADAPDSGRIGDHAHALGLDSAAVRLTPEQGNLGLDEVRQS